MSNLLVEQLDFIYLIYGLTFFFLAMTASFMARRRAGGAAWYLLCAFGILHGLSEWMDMLTPIIRDQLWFNLLRGIVLTGSFLCLFEFGRKSIVGSLKRKAGLWIYLPVTLLILYGSWKVPDDFFVLTRVCLGFSAGLLASLGLWQRGSPCRGEPRRWPNVLGPLALGAYAVSTGLIVPAAQFWPADHFNMQWFLTNTGVPIQVVRCLLSGMVTLALWFDYMTWRTQTYPSDSFHRIRYVRRVTFFAIILLIAGGWALVERADLQSRQEHQRRLMSLSRGMAAVINARDVHELARGTHDLTSTAYLDLRLQCQRISESDPCVRYVYLMAVREGQVVFLLDVEPERFNKEDDKPNAAPGEIYENAPPEILAVFKTGSALVSKPYRDAWGKFVSGYAPVQDAAGDVVAVLGIDEQWNDWLADIAYVRIVRLLMTGGGILLLLVFAILWRREIEEALIRNLNGQRMQLQQSALLRIVNSSFVADGNTFMMAREVTCEAAQVIGVEQVELWIKKKESEKFRAEDVYYSETGAHTSGQLSCVTAGDPFLKLLEEGRVSLSSNVQEDTRFDVIRDELGVRARAVLVAPLRVSGELAGWLAAIQTSRCRNWLTDEMRFLAEMADQVSHAIINHERRLAEEAQRQAHDELERRVRERTEALSQKNIELSREINERLRIEEEQLNLQNKMQQAQKLESLGLMAGGIAHDFNNILMAVLGNVELARLQTPEGSPVYEYLKDIDKASCRAAELARQMLIYSGRGQAIIQGIDLNEMVRDMTSILKVSLSKKIEFTYDLEPGIPLVDGDLTQLRQVVMNLVINASEAIGKERGSISLSTGVIHYDKELLASLWLKEELQEGKYVFLEVVDTGCGMDESTQKRIFDPFFTTKFTGRGLGLAAVLGIIKGHHGAIDVASRMGKGTRFRMILPVGRKGRCPDQTGRKNEVEEWKGDGIILLTDDDPAIRSVGRRMLERIGFSVLEANNGREAVEIFKQEHARIRCVMLDLTLPDLNGNEAFDGIRQVDPFAKIVLCSGFMEENLAGNFPDRKVSGFLQKPYKHETLATLLYSVLNGR